MKRKIILTLLIIGHILSNDRGRPNVPQNYDVGYDKKINPKQNKDDRKPASPK